MKHLVFDVNVVLDLWLNRGDTTVIEALLERSRAGEARVWIAASSLPILHYVCRNELKKSGADGVDAAALTARLIQSLLGYASILSVQGFQQPDLLSAARDLEDAQIAVAATVLHGETRMVSNDATFDALGSIPVLGPDAALSWLDAAPTSNAHPDFIDLKTQQDLIRPQLEQGIHRILHHGQYIMGPELGELEAKLAEYVGVRHCIGVASGTDALLIAMLALGIGPGDEVITTPFTFIATGEMIALIGAVPVYVDIDPRTYNLDPALIEAAVTPRTRAIVPVSLYGQCADMDAINAIAERHELPVIEDAAQSFGATYKGRQSCGLSLIGCTSFFPSKPLGAYGDAGACFTDDEALAKAMREIRVHGQDRRYHHPRIGINGRLDSLQAAVLLAKLAIFPEEVEARARIGARYSELLAGTGCVTPYLEPHNTSVYAQYTIAVDDREALVAKLSALGVPTAVHYPVPLHRQPAFAGMTRPAVPVAEQAAATVVSLPMHPYLTEDDLTRVAKQAANVLTCRLRLEPGS